MKRIKTQLFCPPLFILKDIKETDFEQPHLKLMYSKPLHTQTYK